MEENELLKRAEELCRRSERTGKMTGTVFLTPAEQMLLRERIHPDRGTRMYFFGGYEDSERCICGGRAEGAGSGPDLCRPLQGVFW